MPIRIDAAFQNAQDITLDAFRAPDGAQGQFRDVTLEVDGRAYTVSFANPNAPDVRFASFDVIKGLFIGGARAAVKSRIREIVERASLARDVGSVVAVTGFRDNVKRTINAEKGRIAKEPGGKIAVYGFSAVRDDTGVLVNRLSFGDAVDADGEPVPVMRHQVINDYNTAIGLPGSTDSAALTIAFMRDNDRGRWNYGQGQRWCDVSAAEKDAWVAWLRGKDVDLFSKIRKARADAAAGKRTGWAGEIARQGLLAAIHDLVRKNLDPRLIRESPDVNFVIGAVADAIAEIADTNFGELDVAAIDARISEIVARHAPSGKEAFAKRVLDCVSMAAFWRQTSKLGLDFFKARGQTVVFDWTTFDGRRSDGHELADKWWKRGDADVGDHFGAAITNSEMRHLEGAKYAAKPGAGRLVRIEGAFSPEAAERNFAEMVDSFDALGRDALARLVADLEAGFAALDAATFRNSAIHVLDSLSPNAKNLFLDGGGAVNDPEGLDALCARIFDRLKARIAGTTSLAAKAAMLSCPADVFEAELTKDAQVAAQLEVDRESRAEDLRRGAASPLELRQLAGVDRGFGAQVFFSSRTGRPNELGEALLAGGGDVLGRVDEFRRTVAIGLGVAEENLFGNPAFKAFVLRASREAGGRIQKVYAKLGTVRVAADARAAVDAHLRALAPLTPEAKRVFERRGDWDLNRLIYDEAAAAMKAGRPVDLERLCRNAEVICDICTRTVTFIDSFARRFNPDDIPELRFSEADAIRLENAYLDREGSAVNSYRLHGQEEYVARFDAEAEDALRKASALVLELQTRAVSFRMISRNLRDLSDAIRARYRLGPRPERRPNAAQVPVARPDAPQDPEQQPAEPPAPPLTARQREMLARAEALEEQADEVDARADAATPARLRSIATNAVSLRGGAGHGITALEVLRAANGGDPVPTDSGETAKDRVRNFARAFADRVRDAWQRSRAEAARLSEFGYDDGNTAMQMAFSLYLEEHPQVRAALDRDVDDEVADALKEELYERLGDIPEGDPIRNVTDVVLAHGKL